MDSKPKVVPVKVSFAYRSLPTCTQPIAKDPYQFSMPARSNSHPVWTKDPRKNPKQPEPFDPHDLYRRLEKHQKSLARAEERRKVKPAKAAKAEKQKPPPAPEKYRHVPKYAASQFVNTASPEFVDAHQHFHPLSRLMLRSPRLSEPQSPKTGFMTPRDLELGVPKKQREKLGIATVDLSSIDEVKEGSLAAEREAIAKHPNDKRNDWAQRDERLDSERRFFHMFSRKK